MDLQLKDNDGVVDRSARNEFQKVATTGHDQKEWVTNTNNKR
jgi:hypothetical protein